MQQHAVPQNITGFEFKLVGFLTLKQFGYLVTAAIFSFLFYIGISGILKWFVISPIVLFGLALAFVPVNGMSFDKWATALIRSIISPSTRIWHKEAKEIGFLAPEFSYYLRRAPAAKHGLKPSRARLERYLAQIKARRPRNKLDVLEQTKISSLPLGVAAETSVVGPRPVATPEIKVPESLTATPMPQEMSAEEAQKKLADLGVLEKEQK
jgi:hypothetical protein